MQRQRWLTPPPRLSGLTDAEMRRVDANRPQDDDGEIRPGAKRDADACSSWPEVISARRGTSRACRAFPRILRWRTDKAIDDADSIDALDACWRNDSAGRASTQRRFRSCPSSLSAY
jgi:hypothetical protein